MDPSLALVLKNISKTFKVEVEDTTKEKTLLNKRPTKIIENKVLDDFNFQVKKGEMVGIIGLNGSGKSTLLSIMARIMEPDSGTVETCGKVASVLELGMGFHQDLSGRENIYIKGEMYGFTRKQIDERIESIIDFTGLRNYIDNPLRTYSSGMSGRLAFAIMTNVDADVMLLDEIMSTGDPSFTAKANVLFNNQLKSGKTVIFASQTQSQIEQLCTRAIWIQNGKIVADGPAKSVCAMFQNSINDSVEIISDFANNGVADAQYKLALLYRDGQKIGKDEHLYKQWVAKAAAQGHSQAQVAYADILMNSGSEEDRSNAIMFYQSAAQKGNADAKMKLSALANNSKNAEDLEEIRDIMHQLAEIGHPSHKYQYATLVLRTAWNDEDRKTAFEWFAKSADEGNLEAMLQLAFMHRDGIGTPKDTGKYIEMLTKAADSGHTDCNKYLGEIYLQGKMTIKDDEKSFKYYLRSAELGNPAAQYQIASMYRDGIGTEKNEDESVRWFTAYSNSLLSNYQYMAFEQMKQFPVKTDATPESLLLKAASTYNQRAVIALASMYRGDSSSAPDLEKARYYYEMAAKWPAGSRLTLADMYYKGLVFDQDFKKASELYEKLTYTCDANIDYRLYIMYRDGLGFETDKDKADYYLKRSASRGNLEAQRELRLREVNN